MDFWNKSQVEGSKKIVCEDQFSTPLKLIGGLDVTFVDQGEHVKEFEAVGALVILDFDTLKVLYSDCVELKTSIPYIPGFLGFREEPFAKSLFQRLQENGPQFYPQILFVDGCGTYHPRKFGSASQIGVNLNIPTIGVSKSFLKLDGLEEDKFILSASDMSNSKPLELSVIVDGNIQVATALYNGKSKHPNCYVSVGHKISLSTAVDLTKRCSIFKIPEPIRQADLISRDYIRSRNVR